MANKQQLFCLPGQEWVWRMLRLTRATQMALKTSLSLWPSHTTLQRRSSSGLHRQQLTEENDIEKGDASIYRGVGMGSDGNAQGHSEERDSGSGESEVGAERVEKRKPRSYWESKENRRAFLKGFMNDRGIREAEDWRGVTAAEVSRAGGSALLKRHKGSILRMLQSEIPEGEFTSEKVCLFAPKGHWDSAENRRAALNRIALRCAIEEPQQWKTLTARDFKALGVGSLLGRYGDSVALMLADIYGPEAADVTVVRRTMPNDHWSSAKNRRRFLDELSHSHGLDGSPESWQTLSVEEVMKAGGSGLLARFNCSLLAVLEDSYGSAFGDACRSRRHVPTGYWEDDESLQRFVKGIEKALSISTPEEWMRISREQISRHNGGGSLLRAMPLADALARVYPSHDWQPMLQLERLTKKASQRGLCLAVASVFGAGHPPSEL